MFSTCICVCRYLRARDNGDLIPADRFIGGISASQYVALNLGDYSQIFCVRGNNLIFC